MKNTGMERYGPHRLAFERNRKKIMMTQKMCAICGRPVDFNLKYPHPLSATVDHIIPLAKGGHPSNLDNLQLAHWTCNRQKSDKLTKGSSGGGRGPTAETISNRILPLSIDWKLYRA